MRDSLAIVIGYLLQLLRTLLQSTLIIIVVIVLISTAANGESSNRAQHLSTALVDELAWLSAENIYITEIASKTPLEPDSSPGMVTIITGEELLRRGASDMAMVFEYIPGIEIIGGSIVVRSIGLVWASGKVKYLVDGVSWNSTLAEIYAPYDLPVALIDRIEIIRGPCSALYGKGAFMAVVNIITRKNINSAFARLTEHGGYQAGATLSYEGNNRDFNFTLSLASMYKGDIVYQSGPDVLRDTPFEPVSAAPGRVNGKTGIPGVIFLNLSYKNLSINVQNYKLNQGAFFGFTDALPPYEDRFVDTQDISIFSAKWQYELKPALSLRTHASWSSYTYDVDDIILYPPGYGPYIDGMIAGPHHKEETLTAAIEFLYDNWRSHQVVGGFQFENNRVTENWQDNNYDPASYAPVLKITRFDNDMAWIKPDAERNIKSLFLQDRITANNKLAVTAGLRYDDYDTGGSQLTPRLSMVYTPGGPHIVKAQYAHAFRAPSFIEMYIRNNPVGSGNIHIKAETVKTFELGYIYSTRSLRASVLAYNSVLDSMIDIKDSTYVNLEGALLRGVEAELDWKPTEKLALSSTMAYAWSEEDESKEPINGSVPLSGSIGASYHPVKPLDLSAVARFATARHRLPEDERGMLDGYFLMDFTVTYTIPKSSITAGIGVKNLFDSPYKSPLSESFPEDFKRNGRLWWFRLYTRLGNN